MVIRFKTSHEAAIAMGILSDSNEGMYTMEEAVESGAQLRFLFARLILEGHPACPIWRQYQQALLADFFIRYHSVETATDYALQHISEFLEDGGRTLSVFGLPEPKNRPIEIVTKLEAFDGRHRTLDERACAMRDSMTTEQGDIYDELLHLLSGGSGSSSSRIGPRHADSVFSIEGKPGRGKTYLVDALCSKLRAHGKIILVVGSSALAASLHERGRTAHNLFRIPVEDVCIMF